MSRSRPLSVLLILLLAGLAACSGKRDQANANLPAGDSLLKESAAAMREVKTVTFAIEADGTIGGLALRRANGQLTKEGSAKGNAQIGSGAASLQLDFVVVGDTFYLKGLTGGWQKVPLATASSVYDPSAILDPDRGIAKVLSTASDGRTEAKEKVGTVETYRVAAKLDPAALSAVVPGVGDGVTGKLWIAADNKRLTKATFVVPATDGNDPVNVTVTFSDFDASVNISAP
jgi:lipoprotein LprG